MAEYIERENATEWARLNYCKNCNSYYGVKCSSCGFDDAITLIEEYPAADVVEVVRCKDCKYFDQYSCLYSDEPSGFGKCEKICMDIDLTINDFCSYGERKKEDG